MKFIEGVRDIHSGEKICVIGAAPSLDDYPIDFFKDQICIGVNYVFAAFLDIGDGMEKFKTRMFYSVHEHREPADWIVSHIPHFLKNCFFLLPPKRIEFPRRSGRMVWWEDYNQDPTYMRWRMIGKHGGRPSDEDFENMARCIMEKKNECHYVHRGTTLHWAVEAAVVLGAKEIYVVGAEARSRGSQGHAQKHGLSSFYSSHYLGEMPLWTSGTRCLMKIFKEYGIKIVFYYYGKGEQS